MATVTSLLVLVTLSNVLLLVAANQTTQTTEPPKTTQLPKTTQKPKLLTNENLKSLLRDNKTEEAVELAREIHNVTNKGSSAFNLALTLDKYGNGEEALNITEELFRNLNSNKAMKAASTEIRIWEKIFEEESKGVKEIPELLELGAELTEMQVRRLLLNLYWKQNKKEDMLSVVKATASLKKVMEVLSVSNISYLLLVGPKDYMGLFLNFEEDDEDRNVDKKEIRVRQSVLDVSILPKSLKSLEFDGSEVFRSGGIDLPNLKYLSLDSMASSSVLSQFKTVPVPEIRVSRSPLLDLSTLPPSTDNLKIQFVKKIFASGPIQLPNLKKLTIHKVDLSLSNFTSTPVSEVTLISSYHNLTFLPPTVHKLSLDIVKLGIIETKLDLPNLKYLKINSMLEYLSDFQFVPLNEAELSGTTVDVSLLPLTLQKLSLSKTKVESSSSPGFQIPANLTHLRLASIRKTSWHHFRSFPVTHLEIQLANELNIDLIPETVKNIKIVKPDDDSLLDGDYEHPIAVAGVKQLKKLYLDGYSIEAAEEVLKHLKPKQLVISEEYNSYLPSKFIKLMTEELKSIAVGLVNWGSLPESEKSLLANGDGNTTSKYYLFENGKGKPIQQDQFNKLSEIY